MSRSEPAPVAAGSGYYPALTGLRGVAAVCVVVTHAAFWTGQYADTGLGLMWARLDIGVAIFFALSGFLLFRPWVVALATHGSSPSVTRYLLKRSLRILPAYWITVVLAYVLVPSDIGRGAGALFRNLTLTQIYGANLQHLGLTQMWSLASECVFYLVLPLIAWVLCRGIARGRWRPGRLYAGCVLLAAAGVTWFVVTRQLWVPDATSIWWLPNYLSWFAVGMALAVAAVHHEQRPAPQGLAAAAQASPGSFWAVAVALFAIASTPLAGAATLMPLPLWESLLKNLLYAAAAGLVMTPLVLGPGARLTGWLRSGPAQWLGRISYPIFLLHLIVIEGVVRVLDYPTFTGSLGYVLGCTLAATVALAWVMHRLVEVPVSRWRPGGPEVTAAEPPARSGTEQH